MAICDPDGTAVHSASTPRDRWFRREEVEIVEHQHDGASFRQHPCHGGEDVEVGGPAGAEEAGEVLLGSRPDRVEGQRDVAAQVHRVVVGRRQLHPRERPLVGSLPEQQGVGLPIAGRSSDSHDRRLRLDEALHHVVSGQQGGGAWRDVEPGRGYVARPRRTLESGADRPAFRRSPRPRYNRYLIAESGSLLSSRPAAGWPG